MGGSRAQVALDAGWDPKRIAHSAGFEPGVTVCSGDESAHCQSLIDRFEALRAGPSAEHRVLGDAGMRVFGAYRDRAHAGEEHERIHGRR